MRADQLRNYAAILRRTDSCPPGDNLFDKTANLIERLIAERDALKQALIPSVATKAAYMGEFSVSMPELDENGDEYVRPVNVPWTTIKEIMAAIRARASLTQEHKEDD